MDYAGGSSPSQADWFRGQSSKFSRKREAEGGSQIRADPEPEGGAAGVIPEATCWRRYSHQSALHPVRIGKGELQLGGARRQSRPIPGAARGWPDGEGISPFFWLQRACPSWALPAHGSTPFPELALNLAFNSSLTLTLSLRPIPESIYPNSEMFSVSEPRPLLDPPSPSSSHPSPEPHPSLSTHPTPILAAPLPSHPSRILPPLFTPTPTLPLDWAQDVLLIFLISYFKTERFLFSLRAQKTGGISKCPC